MNNITPEDLVFFNDGNSFQSSGYTLDSILLNGKIPLMQTMNAENESNVQSGGMMSELLKNFAVPAGLLLLQQPTKKTSYPILHRTDDDDGVVDESLYDKIMKMSNNEYNEKQKHKPTRKANGIHNKSKKTRRNKLLD